MALVPAALIVLGVLSSGTAAEKAQQVQPNGNAVTLEMLAREGYEIKVIQSATTRGFGFVVMMQRGANVRSCLMRITREADGRPMRESVCF